MRLALEALQTTSKFCVEVCDSTHPLRMPVCRHGLEYDRLSRSPPELRVLQKRQNRLQNPSFFRSLLNESPIAMGQFGKSHLPKQSASLRRYASLDPALLPIANRSLSFAQQSKTLELRDRRLAFVAPEQEQGSRRKRAEPESRKSG